MLFVFSTLVNFASRVDTHPEEFNRAPTASMHMNKFHANPRTRLSASTEFHIHSMLCASSEERRGNDEPSDLISGAIARPPIRRQRVSLATIDKAGEGTLLLRQVSRQSFDRLVSSVTRVSSFPAGFFAILPVSDDQPCSRSSFLLPRRLKRDAVQELTWCGPRAVPVADLRGSAPI